MSTEGEEYELETIVKSNPNQQSSSSAGPQSVALPKTYNNSSSIFIRHSSDDDDDDYKGGDSRGRGSSSNSSSSNISNNNNNSVMMKTPARSSKKDHSQVVPGSLLSARKPGRETMYESPAMTTAPSNPMPLTPISPAKDIVTDDNDSSNSSSSSSSKGPGGILDKETGIKSNVNWDREEIRTMHEIFPSLDITILVKLLDVNGYDLEKSIDAGLAFAATIEIEAQSSSKPARKAAAASSSESSQSNRNSARRSESRASIGWGSISVNPFASFTNPLAAGGDNSSSGVVASDALGDVLDGKLYTVVSQGDGDSKNRLNRGLPVSIAPSFLAPPRYRLRTDNKSDLYTEFTIWFRRSSEKLGITINEADGEVVIHTLHCKANGQPLLAQEAGVRIGVEVQDVIEILNASGSLVALHFSRKHMFDYSTNTYIANHIESNGASMSRGSADDIHVFVPILIEQQVISRDKSLVVSKALGRLKERVLQWDHYNVIINNNLGPSQQSNGSKSGSSSSSSSSSNIFANQTTDVSDASSSAFEGIFGRPSSTFSILSDNGSTSTYDGSRGGISFPSNPFPSRGSARLSSGSQRDGTAYRSIRPALAIRLTKAEEKADHLVYVIWILDVKSGAEWFVRRRFREFFDFRDYLVTVRSSIARLEFPPKRMSMTETTALVSERLFLLQKFLRRISSLVCCNCIHPSTAKVISALHYFLEVDEHSIMIRELESSPNLYSIRNTPQIYLHSILQLQVLDKVICAYIDNFFDDAGNDADKNSMDYARGVFHSVRDFIDNLQTVLFDGLSDDCAEIINKCINTEKVLIRNSIRRSIHIPSDISMAQVENELIGSGSGGPVGDGLSALEGLQRDLGRYSEEEVRCVARAAVRRQVEVEVYIPCSVRLKGLIRRAHATREREIQEKIALIIDKPQSYFGVPKKHVSASGWMKPVNILREIRHKVLVCDKIDVLLDCAKAIPIQFKMENPYADQPLGADEFLPIFIFVLVRANLPNLLLVNEELQILCDPDKKLSEAGYYIATLEASIQHLEDADIINGNGDSIFSSLHSRMNGSSDFASSWDNDDDGTDTNTDERSEGVNDSMRGGGLVSDSIDFNDNSGLHEESVVQEESQ